MSTTKIALLGAIAGLTIFIGLPLGRVRRPAPRLKAGLNGVAIGILLFLLWDILTHAWEPTDAARGPGPAPGPGRGAGRRTDGRSGCPGRPARGHASGWRRRRGQPVDDDRG